MAAAEGLVQHFAEVVAGAAPAHHGGRGRFCLEQSLEREGSVFQRLDTLRESPDLSFLLSFLAWSSVVYDGVP